MNKADRRELVKFGVLMGQEFPVPGVADVATRLCEINNRLHALYEMDCNCGLTPQQAKTMERLQDEAGKIAASVGCMTVAFHHDPRGIPIHVTLPSGSSNSWGGDGWCVPLTRGR